MNIPLPFAQPLAGAAPDSAIDDLVLDAVARDAWFAFNLSGGKDSTACAFAATALLDQLGNPRSRPMIGEGRGWVDVGAMELTVAARGVLPCPFLPPSTPRSARR